MAPLHRLDALVEVDRRLAQAIARLEARAPTGDRATHARPPHIGARTEMRDDPKAVRAAFSRWLFLRAYFSRLRVPSSSMLRLLRRLHGDLLWRVALARKAAGKPLPTNARWPKGRRVPPWALVATLPKPTRPLPRRARPAPSPRTHHRATGPLTPDDLPEDFPTDDLQAIMGALLDDPMAFYDEAAAAGAFTDDVEARSLFLALDRRSLFTYADLLTNPDALSELYGRVGAVLADPAGYLAGYYADHFEPAADAAGLLAQFDGDPGAFWETYGDPAGVTPEEWEAATGTALPDDVLLRAGYLVDIPDALLPAAAALSDLQVLQLLDQYWATQTAAAAGQAALSEMGVPGTIVGAFGMPNEYALQYLREQAGYLVTGIDETTRSQLAGMMAWAWRSTGADDPAMSWSAMAGMIQRQFQYTPLWNVVTYDPATGQWDPGISRYRAEMIARTELARASSFGEMVSYYQLGVRRTIWLVNSGACLICVGNGESDPVPLGEDYPSGVKAPPQHPLCRCSLAPYTPSSFDPADWTDLPAFPGGLDGLLFNSDYGYWPNVAWPAYDPEDPPAKPTTPADLGMIDAANLAAGLAGILTPDALNAVANGLGAGADQAAADWAAANGVDIPETDAALMDLGGLEDVPGGDAGLGDYWSGLSDDYGEMDLGE